MSDTGVWQLEEGGDLWLVSRQSSAGVPWPGLGLTPLPHSLGGLGRNIILTTMPAGAKLIAGNKPVSFLTAQQLQQLQQQGQATQVRIQTVPASHLQQGTASGSSKAVSTVVVTTAPSPKQAPEQQ